MFIPWERVGHRWLRMDHNGFRRERVGLKPLSSFLKVKEHSGQYHINSSSPCGQWMHQIHPRNSKYRFQKMAMFKVGIAISNWSTIVRNPAVSFPGGMSLKRWFFKPCLSQPFRRWWAQHPHRLQRKNPGSLQRGFLGRRFALRDRDVFFRGP